MSKLSRHIPGRRVSRHSKANTLPSTVAVPIFKSKSFMGPGRVLMGFPIKTLPGLEASFFSPPEAAGAAATGAECSDRGTACLQTTSSSTD